MKRYIKSAIMPLSEVEDETLFELLSDSTTDVDTLKQIAETIDDCEILREVILHPNVTSEIIDIIVNRELRRYLDVYSIIVYNPSRWSDKVSSQNLGTILDKVLPTLKWWCADSVFIVQEIAHHPNLPSVTLQKLLDAYCKEDAIVSHIVLNPNITKDMLRQIVANEDVWDPSVVLKSPIIQNDTDFLYELAEYNDEAINGGLAQFKNTPSELLDKLANSSSYTARSNVAKNPNTPIQTLEHLLEDEDVNIRIAAQLNLEKHK